MDTLNIDINGTPPTQEAIFQLRKMAGEQIQLADKRAGLFKKVAVLLIVVGVLAVLALAMLGWSGIVEQRFFWAVVGVGVMAGIMAAFVAGVGMGHAVGVVGVAVALAVAVALTVTDAPVGAGFFAAIGSISGAGIFAKAIYEDRILKLRTAAEQLLEALVDLNAEDDDLLDACIAYDQICEHDAFVQTYQSKIATEDRKPVMAEYKAARSWMASLDARLEQEEKRQLAQTACERLAVNGY